MNQIITKQDLNIGLDEAWDFFSNPANLNEITPAHMNFKIMSGLGNGFYPGMIITYKIKPFLGITMNWVTEITQLREGQFFIDDQRSGPYKYWHHQHHFRATKNGVEMTDILHYAAPFGIIGKLAELLFVNRQVKHIFNYRKKKLDQLFNSVKK
ncbi:MAG: SRPBCC family protein [Bacteroidales bacterium]|jgi:ligand-binding SRPBCC domain-containing protein|nr:SRPBCC family protein [Bacteroidales bacterium]